MLWGCIFKFDTNAEASLLSLFRFQPVANRVLVCGMTCFTVSPFPLAATLLHAAALFHASLTHASLFWRTWRDSDPCRIWAVHSIGLVWKLHGESGMPHTDDIRATSYCENFWQMKFVVFAEKDTLR